MRLIKTGRILSLLLSVGLILGMLPTTAFAEGEIPLGDSGKITVAALDELPDETLWQSGDIGTVTLADFVLPESLTGKDTYDNPITITGVTWVSEPAFDPVVSEFYYFSPALPQGYILAGSVTAPVISVFVRPKGGVSIQPMANVDVTAVFTDANFLAAVRIAVSKTRGVIYDTDCAKVTSLSAATKKIVSLAGLEYFTGLKTLNINNNQISSLPALPPTLTSLNCSSNQLSSLPALPSGLTTLNCSSNRLLGLDVTGMNLTTINCSKNIMADTAAVAGFAGTWDVGNFTFSPQSKDITNDFPDPAFRDAVRSMVGIASTGAIYDSTNFASVNIVNIKNKGIKSIEGIEYFTSMMELQCSENQIKSLPILPDKVETLSCYDNQLTSLPDRLPAKLTYLDCQNNQLTSLPTLTDNMFWLKCRNNRLTSLPTLPASLTHIYCDGNLLTSLPTLPDNLEYLDCNNNQLTSLPTLPNILTYFNCSNNRLTGFHLSGTNMLDEYSLIDCSYNYMADTSAVTGYSGPWDDNHKTFSPQHASGFKAVTSITGVPNTGMLDIPLTLTGTVIPPDATNKTIVWSVSSGASITGDLFTGTSAGKATVTATITNGLSAIAGNEKDYTQNFTVTVHQLVAPTITSADNAEFIVGLVNRFGVAASNIPTSYAVSGALPSGVTFNTSLGVLSGTPASSSALTYDLKFTATNAAGTSTAQDFTLTVIQARIDITADFTDPGLRAAVRLALDKGPSDSIFNTDNLAGITILDASNRSISSLAGIQHLTGLLELDCSANQLSSLPTLPSSLKIIDCSYNQLMELDLTGLPLTSLICSYNYMADMSKVIGYGGAPNSVTFDPQQLPSFKAVTNITVVPNVAVLNIPLTLTGTVIPDDATNQTIVWSGASVSGNIFTATQVNPETVTATITDGLGPNRNYTKEFDITAYAMPTISAASGAVFTVGWADSFWVTATNTAISYAVTGTLPSGVTFDTSTGVLSGTPETGSEGTYNLIFTATNPAGTSPEHSFTLTVEKYIDKSINPGDHFYYGVYDHASSWDSEAWKGVATYEGVDRPILWRVMDEEGNGGNITVLSKYVLDGKIFKSTNNKGDNEYDSSDIRTFLNGDFMNSFQTTEKQGIRKTDVITGMYDLNYGAETKDGVHTYTIRDSWTSTSTFPLVATKDYVYIPWGTYYNEQAYWTAGNDKATGGIPNYDAYLKSDTTQNTLLRWWLRTPSSRFADWGLCVGYDSIKGDFTVYEGDVRSAYGIRPAIKLDSQSIIFKSEIKDSADTTKGETQANENYYAATGDDKNFKLTVLDNSLSAGTVTVGGNVATGKIDRLIAPGGVMIVTATGATLGTNLTYIIEDASGNIVGYGQGDNSSVTVKATANITGGDLLNNSCAVFVWAQKNNDTSSHAGSEPFAFTMTPTTYVPLSNDGNSDSGSGKSYAPSATVAPSIFVVDALSARATLAQMRISSASKALIRYRGQIRVLNEAWPVFGQVPVDFDTMDGNVVQTRITVLEPGKLTGEKMMSGYIKGDAVDKIKAYFDKWFKNKMRVIHLDEKTDWGQLVQIAAKVDFTDMDTKNLCFYSYNSKTNSYQRITKPNYWVDVNGYLHFTTPYGGDIIISEGVLKKK